MNNTKFALPQSEILERDQKLGVLRLPCVSCVLPEGLVVYRKERKSRKVQGDIISIGVDKARSLV